MRERAAYDICAVCRWEDDGRGDDNADLAGGPTGGLSLTAARQNVRRYGACLAAKPGRAPTDDELPGQPPSPSQQRLLDALDSTAPFDTDTISLAAPPQGVAVAAGRVWVVTFENCRTTVVVIDPAQPERTDAIELDTLSWPSDVWSGPGELWISGSSRRPSAAWPGEGALVKLDLDTMATTTVELERAPATAMASVGPLLYVLVGKAGVRVDRGRPRVVAVERATGAAVRELVSYGGHVNDIAVGDGLLWASAHPRFVRAFNLETGEQVAEVVVGGRPVALTADGDSLWVSTTGAGALYRVDIPRREVVAAIDVGDRPLRPAVAGGDVWVPNHDSGTVSRIDTATAAVTATVEVGGWPCAVATGLGAAWVANRGDRTLTRIPVG